MNEEDFKRVLNEALEPIKKTQGKHTEKLNALWEQTVKLTEDNSESQDLLEFHSKSLKRIEENTEHNASNIERTDKRVQIVEGKLGIAPPAELTFIK